jgi:glutathione S-transferase
MGLKLHTFPSSPNCRKVAALLIELGIEAETILVDMTKGAHKEPAYVAKNPNGKVPMLEEDGWILWESGAIMQYLADKSPHGCTLYPREPRLRAEVNKWLLWDAAHFQFESAFPLYLERVVRPRTRKPARPELHALADENFKRFASVLNGALKGRRYLVGDTLTLADLAILGTMMFRESARLDLSPHLHLSGYLELHEHRDSWRRTAPPGDLGAYLEVHDERESRRETMPPPAG